MKDKNFSLNKIAASVAMIGAALLGAFVPMCAAADRLNAAPTGWRTPGKIRLEGRPFIVFPLSESRGGTRQLEVSMADYATVPDPSASSAAPVVAMKLEGPVAPMSAVASSDADYRTPELIALASGLQNDRDRIFKWVRDNIRFVHYHGCKKGAHLTYLERSGNDIDQSALLVALWRAAGIDCRYVHGAIEMPVDGAGNGMDWYHYLGVEPTELGQLVYGRGTPDGRFGVYAGHAANTLVLYRHWVQANVGGSWDNYDPSLKLIQPITPNLNLAAAMDYNRTSLLGSLGGGTVGQNSITSLNYANLKSYLGERVANFLSTFRDSHLGDSVEQTIGGWVPMSSATVAASTFPIHAAGYFWGILSVGGTYEVLPAALYARLQVQGASKGLNWGPVNMASLRGQRLGLIFETGLAKLKLDDTQVAAALVTTATGAPLALNVSITHAESDLVRPDVTVNESATLASKGDGTYALVYGFEVTSEYLKARQEQLDRYREQGLADTDWRMKLETMNVIGLTWMLQTELAHQLVANLKNQSPAYLHRFGRVAHEPVTPGNSSIYIDIPMNFISSESRQADPAATNKRAAFMADGFIASAMEHGVIEQTQPATGSSVVSTMKIMKLANDAVVPVYLATDLPSWTAVESQLTGYTPSDKSQMLQAITDGGQVLVPGSASITSSQWTGSGYAYSALDIAEPRFGLIIAGAYSGGHSGIYTYPASTPLYNQGSVSDFRYNTSPPTLTSSLGGDPIDMASGDFTFTKELLTAGEGLVRGLNFAVSFHGARRFKNEAKMGYGWTHSYNVRATERADIEGAFGKKTPIEMATSIVGAVIAIDLIEKWKLDENGLVTANQSKKLKNWLATALVANWLVDELKGSGVAITAGDRIWEFHKQGDGSYSAPAGSTVTLTKDSVYHLTERHGPTWSFDTSNRLAQIQDLWGRTLTLAYNTNGEVQSVRDAFGRTLIFTYGGTDGALSRVSEGWYGGLYQQYYEACGIGITVDSIGDLTSLSDAETKVDSFIYLTGHLPFRHIDPNGATVAQNHYDASGRVTSQYTMGDATKVWRFYYAPGMTIEREPSGAQTADTTHFFDDRRRETEVINALGHRMLTSYDGQNRVISRQRLISNGTGGWAVNDVESFGYDADHNLVRQTDPQGRFTSYSFDALNHLTSVTDKRGYPKYFQSYDAQHQPRQLTDREGRITTFITYKPSADPGAGKVATSTEGGFMTSYNYDSRGVLDLVTHPGGATSSFVSNFFGDPTTITDELGRQSTVIYNKRREVTSQTGPGTTTSGPRTTATTYDNARNVGSVLNPRGFSTSFDYSATRKLLTTTLAGSAVLTNHYNARDQVDWVRNPLNQQTSFGLDALGRTTSATDPLNRTSTTIYEDALRRTTSQSPAPLNIQTKVTVDSRGQVVADENGLGHTAVSGYDYNGNQIAWSGRRGQLWQTLPDAEGRLIRAKSPLLRTTTQIWNARGLLETVTEPSGQVTTMGYDGRRRLTSSSDGVGTISYTLNNAGEATAVTQGAAVLGRTYHASGEVATYTNATGETISYDYDKNGNLVSLTYPAIGSVPAATVTYAYDNRDRLSTVTDWAGRVTTYTWDAASQLTQVQRANGTKRVQRYDAAGQLLAMEERPATGAALALRSYRYDSAGRIDRRLAYPQGIAWSEPVWTASYDNDNRLTTLAGAPLSYDADGNLQGSRLPDGAWGAGGISSGASGTYTWNARNQLTRAVRGDTGQQIDYIYDAEGHLIRQTDSVAGTTRWVIDPTGSRVLAKVAPDGGVTRYVYGGALLHEVRADASVRYYHYDQAGSTIALSDAGGAVVGRADYTPYGALQGTSGELAVAGATPFLFVGGHGVITDAATGLHQMRARWYSSHLRRFLSEDPAGFGGGENFYAYAGGNPIGSIDPSGLRPTAADYTRCSPLFGGMGDVRTSSIDAYSGGGGRSDVIGHVASVVFHTLPGVGTALSMAEFNSGRDVFTGDRVSQGAAATNAVLGAVMFAGTAANGTKAVGQVAARSAAKTAGAAERGGLNLFRAGPDGLATREAATGWRTGDRMLNLPNQGSAQANWAQNAGRLRQEMRAGEPIYDSYRDAATGLQIPAGTTPTSGGRFLNAERKLLESRGWQYNPSTGAYHPSTP